VLGKRKGWPKERMHPHSVPLTMLGTGIRWFGWVGFNAGSALGANGLAGQATMNTFVAASAALLGWVIVERLRDGHPPTPGAASGIVAGLVAITPCAGFVGTMPAVIIGLITGAVCFLAIGLKERLGYDDALDVVGVHLVGGLVGTLLLGLFADTAINPAGRDGWFTGGGAGLLGEQALAAGVTIGFSFVVSLIIAMAIEATIGLRVDESTEAEGLDLALHAETAYTYGELGSMGRV
jgi:Amt family ammonium transporter